MAEFAAPSGSALRRLCARNVQPASDDSRSDSRHPRPPRPPDTRRRPHPGRAAHDHRASRRRSRGSPAPNAEVSDGAMWRASWPVERSESRRRDTWRNSLHRLVRPTALTRSVDERGASVQGGKQQTGGSSAVPSSGSSSYLVLRE